MEQNYDELYEYQATFEAFDWIRLLMATLGLSLNIICFVVLSQKKFLNNPLYVYGRALAIFDSIALLPSFIIDFFSFRFNLALTVLTSYSCKIFSYLPDALMPNSAWIVILLALDTLAAVVIPVDNKLTKTVKTNRFRIVAVVLVAVWHLVLAAPIPFVVDTIDVIENRNRTAFTIGISVSDRMSSGTSY